MYNINSFINSIIKKVQSPGWDAIASRSALIAVLSEKKKIWLAFVISSPK